MSEPMKRPPTDRVFTLVCPADKCPGVLAWLEEAGCIVREDVEADEALPERGAASRLKGLRVRENLTQKEFAQRLGIAQRHVSEMERGRRPIGARNARRIAEAFHVDARAFLTGV